ncbi:RNA polymerase sigma factor [Sporosarcina sp. FA9]|uniref:RNA polymerase sigma factor n=1 Tax=Sporosarcina sp. FA9 TaxID=3413030 RepID=UPI003F65F964
MDENEQIPKILDGDLQALQIWIKLHSEKIVRFAYQHGLPIESALEVATQTFDEFQNEIGSINDGKQLLPELYKMIIRKLEALQPISTEQETLFLFEEDAELHEDIGKLDANIRIPLILSKFHDFTFEEIALIINNSEIEISTRIDQAEKSLQIDHIDKRLELLNKSYNRLPVQFKEERITESKTISTIGKKTSKSIRLAFILSTLLVGILITSFITMNKAETIKLSDSEYAVEYTKLRDTYKEALMLTNERFDKLAFIQSADMQMKAFLEEEKNDSLKAGESAFETILNELKIPSQMLKDLSISNSLMNDEDKSIEFLSSYRKKSKDIISIYSEVLWDYRLDVESFETGGYGNKAEQMIKFSDELPEELKNIVASMRNHSITLSEDKTTGKIEPHLYLTEMYQDIIFALHYNMYGYAIFIVNEPYLFEEMMKLSFDESFYHLLTMQDTLEKVKEDDYLYPAMYAEYVELFYKFVKGSRNLNVFDERGIVKNEFKLAWQRYSEMYGVHPTNYLFEPIVEEMEASGWKVSKSWNEFDTSKIEEALKLAKSDELEEFMYGKRPLIDDDSVVLTNDSFPKEVKQLYNAFKSSHDIHVFKGKSPIYTVGVYDYANEMNDPETMYHLVYDDNMDYMGTGEVQSLKDFVSKWRKGFSLFKDAEKSIFSSTSIDRIGYDFIANIEIVSGNMHRNISVYLDKEQNWYLYNPMVEELPSYQLEEDVQINENFKNEAEHHYGAVYLEQYPLMLQGGRAIDIIGVYLYAGEIGDYQAQYALFIQDDHTDTIELEDYVEHMSSNEPKNMENHFSKISFKGLEQDENGHWPGVATLTSNLDENPDAKPEITIPMKWTEDGWRIVYTSNLFTE